MSREARRARFEAAEAIRLGPEAAKSVQGPGPNTVRRPRRFVKKAEREGMSRNDLLKLLEDIADRPETNEVVEAPSTSRSVLGFAVTVLAAYSGALLAIVTWLVAARVVG